MVKFKKFSCGFPLKGVTSIRRRRGNLIKKLVYALWT